MSECLHCALIEAFTTWASENGKDVSVRELGEMIGEFVADIREMFDGDEAQAVYARGVLRGQIEVLHGKDMSSTEVH